MMVNGGYNSLKSRITRFWKNREFWFTWSKATIIATNPSVGSAFLMLSVGYIILWSDAISEAFNNAGLFEYTKKLGGYAWFTSDERLYLVYYGAVFIGIGIMLFKIFCPKECKEHRDYLDYFDYIMQSQNLSKLEFAMLKIIGDARAASEPRRSLMLTQLAPYLRNNTLKANVFSGIFLAENHAGRGQLAHVFFSHYATLNTSKKIRCVIVLLFLCAGIVGVALPSLEVLFMVTRQVAM